MQARCQSVVVGLVLGDGNLTPASKRKKASMLQIGYRNEFLPYLQWIQFQLRPLGVNPIRPKKGYQQHYFYTKPSVELGRLRQVFYPHGQKIVPVQIAQLLTDPLAVAVWYMDDGSLDFRRKDHCNANIATHNFSREDCGLLQAALRKNFGLDVRVHKTTIRQKCYYRLYVPSCSMSRFAGLVAPYIQPCMNYKLPLVVE